MEAPLYRHLQERASARSLSLNQYCLNVLEAAGPEALPFTDIIKRHYRKHLEGIVLFGSHARGTATASSDFDILIVLSPEVPLKAKLYAEWESDLAPHLSAQFSPHFIHLPRDASHVGSLWLEVSLEGKVLFDPHSTVQDFLNKLRDKVSSGDYTRKMSYGVPYWTKKKVGMDAK